MYCLCIFSFRGWDEQVSGKERDRKTKKQRKEREREATSFSKRHQLGEQHRQLFHSVSIFLYVPNR